VTLTILNTDDATEDKLCVLYRGREKTGKTHALASYPSPFFLFCDKNLATLKKHEGHRYVHIQSWKEYCDALRTIQADEIPDDVLTLCVDSISTLFMFCKDHYEAQGFKGHDFWGQVLANFTGRLHDLIDLSKAAGGTNSSRTYHIAVSCHEKDIFQGGNESVLQRIGLKIQGQSEGEVAPHFDSVFCCDTERETVMPKGGGPVEKAVRYIIYTSPPDSYRACGDGVGGGKYNVLPHKMANDYASLCKAWGREE